MITVRHVERLWNSKSHEKLLHELLSSRAEGLLALASGIRGSAAAAAMAIVRLDELHQPHASLFAPLVRFLIAEQDSDGNWGDPATTALAIRALMTCSGNGEAIARGIASLAAIQQADGAWPRVSIRRMPADAEVTAFILFQLGGEARFRELANVEGATHWLFEHEDELRPTSRRFAASALRRNRSSADASVGRSAGVFEFAA